jgi:hypothetical protein
MVNKLEACLYGACSDSTWLGFDAAVSSKTSASDAPEIRLPPRAINTITALLLRCTLEV